MEEKKEIKVRLSTAICMVIIFALIVALGVVYYFGFVAEEKELGNNNKVENEVSSVQKPVEDETTENKVEQEKDKAENNQKTTNHFILYKGYEIDIKTGVQNVSDMKNIKENEKKYNTTYYNYEKGKYLGETKGEFGEETYEGVSVVDNVKRIAISEKYDAIPRKYEKAEKLPEALNDMADCSSVDINRIDLDGDGKKEYIVCYTVNYEKDMIGDGEPQASSGIMLFDSNYTKIDDLVNLENGFWADIKEEEYKKFLSLDNVEYIDIDKDGIMEIIIEVPTYNGTQLSIIKYNKGIIEGKVNYKASVQP